MISLTESDKKLIKSNGGVLFDNDSKIRFEKKKGKPKPACKKRLRELGYEITDYSNARFFPYMDYELRE